MQRIILLIPYFGKWPRWMELYLDSIKRNETIDFFFITDCDTSVFNGINNIRFEASSFVEYINRFKKLLGDDINIPNPYKICDLRPFFALVHDDIIRNYDFFGWTDVDVLFGDIRSFYTENILRDYDALSTHEKRLSGHFALLRNNEKYRRMGYRIYRWKQALLNPEFVGIDEHGITHAMQMTVLDKIAEKFKFSTQTKFLNTVRRLKTQRHYFVEQYTTPFTPIPWIDGTVNSAQPDVWFYERGTISNSRDQGRKFMYLHLMNFKSGTWRADHTPAPWQNGFVYEVYDVNRKIIIDSKGISNLS